MYVCMYGRWDTHNIFVSDLVSHACGPSADQRKRRKTWKSHGSLPVVLHLQPNRHYANWLVFSIGSVDKVERVAWCSVKGCALKMSPRQYGVNGVGTSPTSTWSVFFFVTTSPNSSALNQKANSSDQKD